MGKTSSGDVPHVTSGAMSSPFMVTTLSNLASSSLKRVFQYASAISQDAPLGLWGRPLQYSKVFSSGAIKPARAPPSMAILQTVIRPSIDSSRIACPQYSIT